jgi:hypothetical protein
MTRRCGKYGESIWEEPMTQEERDEREIYALSGTLPFASIPAKADRTNVTPFPLLRLKLKRLKRLQPGDIDVLPPSYGTPADEQDSGSDEQDSAHYWNRYPPD